MNVFLITTYIHVNVLYSINHGYHCIPHPLNRYLISSLTVVVKRRITAFRCSPHTSFSITVSYLRPANVLKYRVRDNLLEIRQREVDGIGNRERPRDLRKSTRNNVAKIFRILSERERVRYMYMFHILYRRYSRYE